VGDHLSLPRGDCYETFNPLYPSITVEVLQVWSMA